MNFLSRLQGIFSNPQPTFRDLSEKPVWVDALIVLLVALVVFSYLVGPYAQKESLQVMKNNVKLQERMGKERFDQMINRMEHPTKASAILRTFILSPITFVIGFLFSSLVILVLGRLSSTEGKFRQVFSALLHANFIDKILGNALRLVLVLTRKSVMQTTTSLAIFFPKLEVTSPAFIVLSQVDLFQLWLFGVLAYGLSAIFKTELKKALFISYGFWVLKSLLYIAFGLYTARFIS
jgi:hypothetical protein